LTWIYSDARIVLEKRDLEIDKLIDDLLKAGQVIMKMIWSI